MENEIGKISVAEETDAAVHNPHDKGYKRELAKPKEFLHFLKKYVQADWINDLDVSQLRLCDKEFIDKDYEGREADLIYEVTKHDGKKIYLFILQELQSTVDYTMVFRVLIYVVNNLLRFFLSTPKEKRERKDFRLPAMIPIVFYSGEEKWTAVKCFKDYQHGGKSFNGHVLNIEYYLIDLAKIDENYILSTNTIIDNIMYCDRYRKKEELPEVLKNAYRRVKMLAKQEQAEFDKWVRYILLSVCGDKEAVLDEILVQSGNGEEDMAFKYNIIKMFEDEHAEGVYTDQTEHSERRFRADLPPFQSNLSALLSTSFRKSSAHLSGYECNDRFSIPPESLFRVL